MVFMKPKVLQKFIYKDINCRFRNVNEVCLYYSNLCELDNKRTDGVKLHCDLESSKLDLIK